MIGNVAIQVRDKLSSSRKILMKKFGFKRTKSTGVVGVDVQRGYEVTIRASLGISSSPSDQACTIRVNQAT